MDRVKSFEENYSDDEQDNNSKEHNYVNSIEFSAKREESISSTFSEMPDSSQRFGAEESPFTKQLPLPTKPRTIITLPHLIGRRSNQTTPINSSKTPIIIRERIETPTSARTTFSSTTSNVNTQVIKPSELSEEDSWQNTPNMSAGALGVQSPIKNTSKDFTTGETNENLPSIQERIEQFQQITKQRQINNNLNANSSPQNFKNQILINRFNNSNEKESPRIIKIFNNLPSSNSSSPKTDSPKINNKINQANKLTFLSAFTSSNSPIRDITDSMAKNQFINNFGDVCGKNSQNSEPVKHVNQAMETKRVNKAKDIENRDSDDYSDSEENIDANKMSLLAIKVQRNNSLARFLKERPNLRELQEKNILHKNTDEQRKVEREEIEIKLDRKLSLRPTPKELEERNILHCKTQEELTKEKEETKKLLVRKLSYRPTIQELKDKRIIRFCDYIEVTEVEDYDRRADKPWTRLTPKDKALIRNELNLYKSTEMEVHEESRHLTRFHKP